MTTRAVIASGGRALIVLLGGTALLVTLAGLVAWLAPDLLGDQPATCLQGGGPACFCEAVGTGLLRQPANSLSSLAFAVTAVAVLWRGRRMAPGPSRRLVPVLALACTALATASLAYHARLGFAGQLLDLQGMYVLAVLLLVGARWRRGRLGPAAAAGAAAGLLVALATAQVLVPGTRRWLFVVVLVPGLVVEWRVGPSRALRRGVALLLLGYAAWLTDNAGLLCDPTSWLQGHAVWHLLTAAAAYQLTPHWADTETDAGTRTADG